MLKNVVIQSATPMLLDIDNVDPDEILILTSISGLSNVKTNLFLGEFAREGGYYQGRRATPLNPVFNFKINPDYANDVSASDVREMLYRIFMEPSAGSDAVQVLLVDSKKPDRYFDGYTESIEADIFEKGIGATVSMLTTDPYLRSAEVTEGSDVGGWFDLPLTYDGSADTGLELTLKVLDDTDHVRVRIPESGQTMLLTAPFLEDDVLTINTSKGSREIRKNGVDIMAAMTAASRWLSLNQQTNTLVVDGNVADDGKAVLTSYRYRSAWWGI